MRALNQFLSKQSAQLSAQLQARQSALVSRLRGADEEPDVCPRCGASPRSLMPAALMCAACRESIGNQSWRAPITLRG
jgi:hypothetical protein